MRGRLLIAAGVVGSILAAFLAAYIANGIGQWKTGGVYIPPAEFVDIIKMILQASVCVLTLGSIVEVRQAFYDKNKLEKKDYEITVIKDDNVAD